MSYLSYRQQWIDVQEWNYARSRVAKISAFVFFFYDNYYYTVAVFFISARIRITVLIVTGTLIHLVTMRILIRI